MTLDFELRWLQIHPDDWIEHDVTVTMPNSPYLMVLQQRVVFPDGSATSWQDVPLSITK